MLIVKFSNNGSQFLSIFPLELTYMWVYQSIKHCAKSSVSLCVTLSFKISEFKDIFINYDFN